METSDKLVLNDLEKRIRETENYILDIKSKKKNFWEIWLLPIVLTLLSVLGGWFANDIVVRSNERQFEIQKRIQAVDVFQKLISGDTSDKEMAVRLLNTIDSTLSYKFAFAIASNRSEKKEIVQAAFNIGKQVDKARFLIEMLESLNIVIGISDSDEIKKKISNPYSGYPQLAEKILNVLDRSVIKNTPPDFTVINQYVKDHYGRQIEDITQLESSVVEKGIVYAWLKRNPQYDNKDILYSDIVY